MNWLKIIEELLNNPAMKSILVSILKNNAEAIVDLLYGLVAARNNQSDQKQA